jgi:hypothetical protein
MPGCAQPIVDPIQLLLSVRASFLGASGVCNLSRVPRERKPNIVKITSTLMKERGERADTYHPKYAFRYPRASTSKLEALHLDIDGVSGNKVTILISLSIPSLRIQFQSTSSLIKRSKKTKVQSQPRDGTSATTSATRSIWHHSEQLPTDGSQLSLHCGTPTLSSRGCLLNPHISGVPIAIEP